MNGAPKQVLKTALGLGDTGLGTGDLGSVAQQEVVLSLFLGQSRNGRQARRRRRRSGR